MKRRAAAIFFLAAVVSTALAAVPQHVRTSDRFGYSTYLEEGSRLTVLADGYPASVGPKTGYIPVPVAVAMTGRGRPIVLRPESFTLIDADGHAVPAANYREITTKYARRNYDRSLTRVRPIAVPESIVALHQVPARFYPPVNGGTRTADVELATSTWFRDVLYFPVPPSGLHGVLTLRVDVPDQSPVEVRFVADEKGLSEPAG